MNEELKLEDIANGGLNWLMTPESSVIQPEQNEIARYQFKPHFSKLQVGIEKDKRTSSEYIHLHLIFDYQVPSGIKYPASADIFPKNALKEAVKRSGICYHYDCESFDATRGYDEKTERQTVAYHIGFHKQKSNTKTNAALTNAHNKMHSRTHRNQHTNDSAERRTRKKLKVLPQHLLTNIPLLHL